MTYDAPTLVNKKKSGVCDRSHNSHELKQDGKKKNNNNNNDSDNFLLKSH